MKIGIDISQISYSGTGVSRYLDILVRSLLKYDQKNEYVYFYSSLRQPLNPKYKNLILEKQRLKEYSFPPILLSILWNDIHIFSVEKFIGKVDIFVTSDWTEPPASYAKKITVLHDLLIYKFPEISNFKTKLDFLSLQLSANIVNTQKKRLKWVKKESDLIVCDSSSTIEDAEKILNIDKNRLKLLYPAVLPFDIGEKNREAKFITKLIKPYILSVGKVEPRKNLQRLVESFSQTDIPDLHLYIAGPQGWGDNPKSNLKNIHFLGYVKDEELFYLYKNALFFVYPSLYEGFGYPVVEAMASGCPVITSNTSSLKEIAVDSAILVDPYSVREISHSIKMLYNNSQTRDILKQKGLRKAKFFNNKRFAQEWLSVFESII
ncbi:MAG: Glycosyl transferase group 1 [Candidatus Roizmanbacteria bacterium GW2011_GWA2_36_23]|uniref:Glycosyl transferase group 1 n=1 Tax=Candidatus Roizmanbacteria bacterium GW2011_GWA2_36_23 TaxID=1618480 RepID=A0A0G0E4Q1_9BACT|nr:MAG: Glycosyl transferase group 1 [Candidatus Roizmanbacteria bacterium GW2011_GWA2_36_23]